MDIVNTTKEERILLNTAKIKMLENDKTIKSLTFSRVCLNALKHYIGGNCGKSGNKRIKAKSQRTRA